MTKYFLVILLTLVSHLSHAQEDDDFFDDEFEEPYEDPLQPSAPPPRGGAPLPRNAPTFNAPPPNPSPAFNQNRGGMNSGGANGEEIVFRLVDPPKYWKPKKRRFQPPINR